MTTSDQAAHEPEVIPVPPSVGAVQRWRYRARCDCGWYGQPQYTIVQAKEEAALHVIAIDEPPER